MVPEMLLVPPFLLSCHLELFATKKIYNKLRYKIKFYTWISKKDAYSYNFSKKGGRKLALCNVYIYEIL